MVFDDFRRLFASNCSELGGGASSLGGGCGLVALLAFPVLLDLAFDFGAGSDDALVVSHGFLCGFTGISGCVGSISGGGCGGDGAFADVLFRRDAAKPRNNFPSCA